MTDHTIDVNGETIDVRKVDNWADIAEGDFHLSATGYMYEVESVRTLSPTQRVAFLVPLTGGGPAFELPLTPRMTGGANIWRPTADH